MGRATGLNRVLSFETQTLVEVLANGASFNAASQLTAMSYSIGGAYSESRAYNEIGQLTSINLPGVFGEQYVYPPPQQNLWVDGGSGRRPRL